MNQRVHMRLHCFAIGKYNFWIVGLNRAGLQARQGLQGNLVRLLHLAHAHQVARPHVAIGFGRNLKIVFFITRVRVGAANVQLDAATTQAWSGQAPINRVFR